MKTIAGTNKTSVTLLAFALIALLVVIILPAPVSAGTARSGAANWKLALNDYVGGSSSNLTANDVSSYVSGRGAPSTPGFGPEATFCPKADNTATATLSEGKFVVAYRDLNNSYYGTAIIGEVSGKTITYGTAAVFDSTPAGGADYICVSALSPNKFVVAYQDHGNSNKGTAVIGDVSGNVITYGTPVVFNDGAITYQCSVSALSTEKFVVAFCDDENSSKGTAIIGDVTSGNVISYGSEYVFNDGSTGAISVSALSAGKFIVAFCDDDNSYKGTAIIGRVVSGNGISYGSEYIFNEGGTYYTSIPALSDSKFVVAYEDTGNSNKGTAIIGDVSESVISYGPETVFNPGDTQMLSASSLSENKFVAAYRDYGDGQYGTAIVGDVTGNTITCGPEVVYDSSNDIGYINHVSALSTGKFVIAYGKYGSGGTINPGTAIIGGMDAPGVRTDPASSVTTSGATFNGAITSVDGEQADYRGFHYRRAGSDTWTDWGQSGVFGTGAFSHSFTGLEPGTGYEYQAIAHNSGGWSYGATASFTTVPTPTNWYLAEGTTAWGFNCYITIENPNASAVSVNVTYNTEDGAVPGGTINLPAMSQTTVNPGDLLGQKDFSTLVTAPNGETIAVDRTMQWTGQGASSPEAHNSIGVTSPAKTWYLPEGSTSWGFETWLLIQNPNNAEAACSVTYMIEGADPVTLEKKVPANSRKSYNMASDIGEKDASIKVTSSVPVIPERAMYRNNRREGHDSIGTTSPATDFYLAEGAVGYDSGYITYVLVQNPQNEPNKVTVTYLTGSGEVAGPTIDMAPNSRKTIRVNDQLPPATDVSTRVHGEKPVIAERAMYWNSPAGEACHDSIGMDGPHRSFYLPDGQTSEGRETWTLVSNPNAIPVEVRISYLPAGGGATITFTDILLPNSRKSYNMADKLPSGRASVLVESIMGGPVMCERAMYWNSRGAGTDTIGGYSD